ncbi:MAG: ATP-binding protein [Pseudothermotoga sp.]
MAVFDQQEGQRLEFKREWTDRALEDIAAFANTDGGTLLIGIRDNGEIVGAKVDDKEVQRIANLITTHLGITPTIELVDFRGCKLIKIVVQPAPHLVAYNGRYLRRVGSTNRDFAPEELARHILLRSGRSWDSLPSEWSLREIDEESINHFAQLAQKRLPYVDPSRPEHLLENLGLIHEGKLRNAGVILFARRPQRLFPLAQVRIGIFKGTQILDSHDFQGTLWQQLDGAMERFRQILKVRFDIQVDKLSLEGLQRKEIWEYPLEALREAVVNALIHRDYTFPADVQIRLQEDQLEIWSPGELPPPLTPEALYEVHQSVLRNSLIAQAFYFAGIIERWGTGTTRIVVLCREQGLPTPEFVNWQGGVRVTFRKDPYAPERLRKMGLKERQIQIIAILRQAKDVSMGDLSHYFPGISTKTIQRDIQELIKMGLVTASGEKKGRRYGLAR